MSDEVWVVIVGGGTGQRFGRPKQFEVLGGRPVLEWAIDAARSVADEVVLVLPPQFVAETSLHGGCSTVVVGGLTRAESVRAGLAAVPPRAAVIVIHDAARPLASPDLFRAVVAAVRDGADGAIPALAVTDTIKRVEGSRVAETLRREELVAVQTPQAFRADVLRRAHAGAGEATDDASLVEALGALVLVVPGETGNLKLTAAPDLARLEEALSQRKASADD